MRGAALHQQAAAVGRKCGGEHQQQEARLAPGIKQERGEQQNDIAVNAVFAQVVGDGDQREKGIDKGDTAKYHGSVLQCKVGRDIIVDISDQQDLRDVVPAQIVAQGEVASHIIAVVAQIDGICPVKVGGQQLQNGVVIGFADDQQISPVGPAGV